MVARFGRQCLQEPSNAADDGSLVLEFPAERRQHASPSASQDSRHAQTRLSRFSKRGTANQSPRLTCNAPPGNCCRHPDKRRPNAADTGRPTLPCSLESRTPEHAYQCGPLDPDQNAVDDATGRAQDSEQRNAASTSRPSDQRRHRATNDGTRSAKAAPSVRGPPSSRAAGAASDAAAIVASNCRCACRRTCSASRSI